jgi:hypothetical protein
MGRDLLSGGGGESALWPYSVTDPVCRLCGAAQ